jgi:hypothetical protein
VADERFLYLLKKYPQEVAGRAPWPCINAIADEELRADLCIAAELRDSFPSNTYESAVGGGVIGGWLAQALRMRPAMLRYPAGLI